MKVSSVFNCNVLSLNKIHNLAGNITPVGAEQNVSFQIKRVYYLYDVPGGEARGGHAHKALQQLIVAASGSFDVLIDDGKNKKTMSLNRSYYGLYIVPGIWRELLNFSSGAICLVLASHHYDADDYIRDYNNFLMYKNDTSLI